MPLLVGRAQARGTGVPPAHPARRFHRRARTGHGALPVPRRRGGTAFYRHRATGFECVDDARRDAYFARLKDESEGDDAPAPGYIRGDTPLFQRIDAVAGVFNRLLVYRRNSLHSGDIDDARVPPPDPLAGRLSINSFIDVLP